MPGVRDEGRLSVQALWESQRRAARPSIRIPLRESQKFPDTGHRAIASKTLKGIWATAHSSTTARSRGLYDLLLTAEKRPTESARTKEYDPSNWLASMDGRGSSPPRAQAVRARHRLLGNWNTGHEWWLYPDLDDA